MQRFLVVIGLQPDKIEACGKPARKILDWVKAHYDEYAVTISIIRRYDQRGNVNRSGNEIIEDHAITLDYYSDQVIGVTGFDVDCTQFRRDVQYDIVGISTSASVLCCALSMFSANLNVRVIENLCCDRKGKDVHAAAIKIMKTWMPKNVV